MAKNLCSFGGSLRGGDPDLARPRFFDLGGTVAGCCSVWSPTRAVLGWQKRCQLSSACSRLFARRPTLLCHSWRDLLVRDPQVNETALADPSPADICHMVGGVNPSSLWHRLLPTQTWVGFDAIKHCRLVCLLHKKRAPSTRSLHVGLVLRGDHPVVAPGACGDHGFDPFSLIGAPVCAGTVLVGLALGHLAADRRLVWGRGSFPFLPMAVSPLR